MRSWLEIVDVPYLPSPAAHTMSSSLQLSSSSTPKIQPIFEQALEEYKKKTGNELTAHPLAAEINGCNSPNAILPILERKAHELNQSGSSDERLFKWLLPTTTVLHTLSVTLGESVGLVCYQTTASARYRTCLCPNDNIQIISPTKIIFSAIGILLVVSLFAQLSAG